MTVHTLFSKKSDLYEVARPLYPENIYQYLAQLAPSNGAAWDCACGNGQAAISLVRHFESVSATDVSEEQIAHAKQHKNIQYSVSPSEETPFADNSFDLACVAQALHWFDFEKYWPEVKRVLKPNGVFAAWGYVWPSVNSEFDPLFSKTVLEVIEPYWAPQNQLLCDHYQNVEFPFTPIDTPKFEMKVTWTLDEFMSFIRTFSATRLCIEEQGEDFFLAARQALVSSWGAPSNKREIDLDFVFIAGRMDQNS